MGSRRSEEAPTSGVLLAVGGPLVTQGCRSHNALELVSRKETTKKGITKGTSRSFTRHLQKKMSESVAPAQRLAAKTCIRKNSSAESMCDANLKHDVEAEKVRGNGCLKVWMTSARGRRKHTESGGAQRVSTSVRWVAVEAFSK